MTAVEVNYFVRLLSSVYVYFWIPIRLSYLRLKFKLRPVLKMSCEVFAITALITTGVPLSIVYMIAKGIKHLIKLWVKLLCNIIAITTGIDYETLYNSTLSEDRFENETVIESTEVPEENTNEQPIDNTVREPVGSDDKNEPETTE